MINGRTYRFFTKYLVVFHSEFHINFGGICVREVCAFLSPIERTAGMAERLELPRAKRSKLNLEDACYYQLQDKEGMYTYT